MTDVVVVSETEIVAVDDTVGGGGAPSGAAGGVLGGTYPNPGFAADMATQAELDAHVSDASAAHAATAVSYAGGTGMSATDVEAAIDELATEKQNAASVAADAGVTAHLADTGDAHDASAISFAPTGTIAATDVQAAIAEVASEAGSGSGVALTQAIAQTAHGLAVGDLARYNGTAYVKAQADSAANAEVIGIVSAAADADNFTLLTDGKVTGLSGLTAGSVYFLSPTTAGARTVTEPTTVGQVSKPVLIAVSTTVAVFLNLRGIVIGADVATQAELDAHLNDTVDAHDATAVSFAPAGSIAATTVQAAIEEVASEAGGGGAVATDAIFDAKGDLPVGTGANTAAKLTAGANGLILTADSGEATGLKWAAAGSGAVAADAIWDAKGDLAIGTGADTADNLPAGTNFIASLIPDSTTATGMRWSKPRSALSPTGALYETFPRHIASPANVAAVLVSQRLSMVAIDLPNDLLVTSITFMSGGTAMVTGVHQLFGLYDGSRNLLRGSDDDTNVAWAATTVKTLDLTSTFTTTYAGLHYLGILVEATTVPTLMGNSTAGGGGPLGIAPILVGNSSTGQTSLPNPAGAITFGLNMFWAYVS